MWTYQNRCGAYARGIDDVLSDELANDLKVTD